jgi:hypothetical protein
MNDEEIIKEKSDSASHTMEAPTEQAEKRLLEIRLRNAELEIERSEKSSKENKTRRLAWDSPLVLAIVGAVGTALLAIINNRWQYESNNQAERTKLESSLILKAMEPSTAGDRKKFLVFLLDAGLLADPAGKIREIPEEQLPQSRVTLPPTEAKSKYLSLIPVPQGVNPQLSPAKQSTLMEFFGAPGAPTRACSDVTSEKLKQLIATRDVGPFKATGLAPALDAIARVMNRVKSELPELYGQLRSQGMTCVRTVRGSTGTFSNHAWGTAIDLSIADDVDIMGDGRCFQGLALLAPLFNEEVFYWGGGSPTEDAMHFEVSEELLGEWRAKGVL